MLPDHVWGIHFSSACSLSFSLLSLSRQGKGHGVAQRISWGKSRRHHHLRHLSLCLKAIPCEPLWVPCMRWVCRTNQILEKQC